MRVIGDNNQISEDVFDFMISYLPFPKKSIRSELAKLFSISIWYTIFKIQYWTRSSIRQILTFSSQSDMWWQSYAADKELDEGRVLKPTGRGWPP